MTTDGTRWNLYMNSRFKTCPLIGTEWVEHYNCHYKYFYINCSDHIGVLDCEAAWVQPVDPQKMPYTAKLYKMIEEHLQSLEAEEQVNRKYL